MNDIADLNLEFYEESISFSEKDLEKFAEVSGDFNPIHMNEEFAISQGFTTRIVHGALMISRVSGIIATKFPGPGTIIGSIEWKFILPVQINQDLILKFTLARFGPRKGILELRVLNPSGKIVQESKIVLFLIDKITPKSTDG
jgi:3-hydroxybutyryl-CoA dehydratase